PDGSLTPLAGIRVAVYPYSPEVEADLRRIRDGARDSGRDYEAAVGRVQDRLRAYAAQVGAAVGQPIVEPAPPPSSPGAPAGTRKAGSQGAVPGASGATRPDAPAGPDADAPASQAGGLIRRVSTDPDGLFVFEDLPAGDWLLVAVGVTPYAAPRSGHGVPAPRHPGRGRDAFLPRASTPAKDAEVWVARVRVTAGERTRLFLTDRSRFMAGPVR